MLPRKDTLVADEAIHAARRPLPSLDNSLDRDYVIAPKWGERSWMNLDVLFVIVSETGKRNSGLFEDESDMHSGDQVDPESSNRNSRFNKQLTLSEEEKNKLNLF